MNKIKIEKRTLRDGIDYIFNKVMCEKGLANCTIRKSTVDHLENFFNARLSQSQGDVVEKIKNKLEELKSGYHILPSTTEAYNEGVNDAYHIFKDCFK